MKFKVQIFVLSGNLWQLGALLPTNYETHAAAKTVKIRDPKHKFDWWKTKIYPDLLCFPEGPRIAPFQRCGQSMHRLDIVLALFACQTFSAKKEATEKAFLIILTSTSQMYKNGQKGDSRAQASNRLENYIRTGWLPQCLGFQDLRGTCMVPETARLLNLLARNGVRYSKFNMDSFSWTTLRPCKHKL